MSEEDSDEELTISVEYTPMEIVTCLQLMDYMDMEFMREGKPVSIFSIYRDKLLEAIVKKDVYEGVQSEREEALEDFKDSFGHGGLNTETRDGFQ